MDPQKVIPNNFKPHEIIHTSADGNFSICIGKAENEKQFRFAMRWNGNIGDSDDKGFPLSSGHPMWFQLPPDYIHEALLPLIKYKDEKKLRSME